jgi:ubiquinone/menaquinone biosynthesis C-methylase UbiE
MNEAEFDKFADEYHAALSAGITMSGEAPEYFSEYKVADIARHWRPRAQPDVAPLRLLDFGAGIGNSVPYVRKYFPGSKLSCVDLSQRSLTVAEKRFPAAADYVHFDGANLPFEAAHFDIAFAMVVFHHIPHEDHHALFKELQRVLRPGGNLFIFEHNPYNPLTVRVVNNCAFDENARLIKGRALRGNIQRAGFRTASTRYRVFFPHALRVLRPLEPALAWLPLGGQYFVHAVK